ncbi:MAG: MFS transporter [Deltaproteobacteria bacterium]|uniref:MFS transporter n=1 Tax=Candidatus Zymogenus saltonus TaxID=2844893 RepID=A0A9D8KD33_9DELT|nr:MFS transporter [Candidatus Zymogenus saltonus]
MEDNKLSRKTMLGYGIYDLGGNLFFTAMAFVLLIYLTDTVLIAPALAGAIVAIGKIWDAVTDPVVGYMSDRTKTRWGRRRPYMFFGSILLVFAMIMMFTNPLLVFDKATFFNPDVFSEGFDWTKAAWNPKEHQTFLLIWGIVFYCFLNLAYTIVNIPYSSLTPELTKDYHERTVLNGYRFGCAVFGTLLGAGASFPIVYLFPNTNVGFMALGFIFGIVMLIVAMITVFSIREPEWHGAELTQGFFKTYFKVFRNKPYILITMTYMLHLLALSVVTGVAAYYFKYIHQAEKEVTTAMLILLVTAMLFIPISVVLGKKIGKKLVYIIGMAAFALSILVIGTIGHIMPMTFSFIMMFSAGLGLGFMYVPPYAMLPDTVEYDYLISGERTEGSFYAIFLFFSKVGQAFALATIGIVLQLTRYTENIVPQPDPLANFGILILMGAIPAIFFFIGMVVVKRYPITEERYAEILKEIEIKDAKKAGK